MFPISLFQTPFPYNPDPTIPVDDWMTGPQIRGEKNTAKRRATDASYREII